MHSSHLSKITSTEPSRAEQITQKLAQKSELRISIRGSQSRRGFVSERERAYFGNFVSLTMPTTRSRTCVRKSSKAITPVKNKSAQPLQCAICLDNISKRGKLPTCHHHFCFTCIHEWSKVNCDFSLYVLK